MECVFCKIASGTIFSYTIYEDMKTKVFLDINPDTNGHLLIIPKKHFKDIYDIDIEYLNTIMLTCQKMATRLQNKLKVDGVTIVQNNGLNQEVKHFHIHLKPVYKDEVEKEAVQIIYEKLK